MSRLQRATLRASRINWRSRNNLLRLLALLTLTAFMVTGILFLDRLSLTAGYSGIALLALVASGGLVLPAPALATVCGVSVVLVPLILGLVAGTAETVGELTGYFIGYSGEDFVRRIRWYPRVVGWLRKRGWLLLLLLSLVPNPVFDIAGVAAGAVRYPLPAFLSAVWIGKVAKFTGVAYACAFGIEWVMRSLR